MKLEISAQSPMPPPPSFRSSKSPRAPEFPSDDISQYADRDFDDGFVYMDPSTVNFGGDTWYWGFDHASQADASADTLTFHRTLSAESRGWGRTVTSQSLGAAEKRAESDVDAAGVGVKVEYRVGESKRIRWRVGAGMSALGGLCANETFAWEQRVRDVRTQTTAAYAQTATYRYDLMGVNPFTPEGAPYRGTYDGPGTLLPNRPQSVDYAATATGGRTRTTSVSETVNYAETRIDVEGQMYEFWLGPTLDWTVTEKIALSLSPRITATLVDLDVDQTRSLWSSGSEERSTSAENGGETAWQAGAAVQAGITLALTANWLVEVEGGYEWVEGDTTVRMGPNTVKLKASGYTAAAYLVRRW
jgi:hypothetical protein